MISLAAKSLHMLFPLLGTPHGQTPPTLHPKYLAYSYSLPAPIQEVFFICPPKFDAAPTTTYNKAFIVPLSTKSDFPHQWSPTFSSGHRRCSIFTCWMNKWNIIFNLTHSSGPHCGLAYSTIIPSFLLSSLPAFTLMVLVFKLNSIICLFDHYFLLYPKNSQQTEKALFHTKAFFQNICCQWGIFYFSFLCCKKDCYNPLFKKKKT